VSRISGVTIGLVKSLDDPEGLGRVQLTFPWMSEDEPESNWARIAVPMAGAERGMQFMPEVGDEVLVAFEQGELRLPYVLGGLWNGEDKPPRDDPKLRTIQTVSGHVLEFDDTEGSEKISLLFKGDLPSIVLEADSVGIKLSANTLITMDSSSLTIQFDGGNSITLSSGGVKVSGTKIELN
jgi:uncharacterized protein involved in type VI secretion and phage assembly